MYAVIIGCGRVGARLAAALSAAGHSVVAVDHRQEALDELPPDFSGFKLLGDGAEPSVMDRARLADADAIACVAGDDNVNTMVALTAALIHGKKQVLARIYDAGKTRLLADYGVTVVSPPQLAAEHLIAAITGSAVGGEA